MANKDTKVHPIIVAVLSSRFETIAKEMAKVLLRTSRSTVFSEAGDFALGIFDKDCRLIAQKEYVPVLAGANTISLKNIAAAYECSINEGDLFIHNDPYAGNTHLADINIAKPVFYKGALMFWSMVKGHMCDTGNKGVAGADPTSTTIWQDGLIIPAIKLYDRGQLNTGARDLFLRNLRLPEIVWGDIMCEIGGCIVGERKLLELLDRYGPETLYNAIDEILAASEREMRNMIRQIPDGVYYGEKSTDHDAIFRDRPVTARVKITIKGDELTIDLSDSDPTVRGYINSTEATTFSVCHMITNYALPGVVNRNEGSMVPIKIIAPEGRWINPTFPGTVTKCTTIASDCIGEAMLLALSKAIPSWIAAPHGKMAHFATSGFNPRTKRQWVDIDFFMSCTPSGGTEGYDGWDLGGSLFQLGALRVPDIEIIELLKPVHILQFEQRPDSAGAGQFRSGLGHNYKYKSLADCYPGGSLAGAGMRDFSTPSGLFGGKSPKPNVVVVHRVDGRTDNVDVHSFCDIYGGDIVEAEIMGAAGFGNPLERDIEKVKEDVRNEVVSIEGAKTDYGVVINPVTLEVDYPATEELRKSQNK